MFTAAFIVIACLALLLRMGVAADILELRRTRGPVEQASDKFNICDYGAVDDASVDSVVSIQAAVDAAYAAGGGMVEIPKGTYGISKRIKLRSNVTIAGHGYGSHIVAVGWTDTIYAAFIADPMLGSYTNIHLRDFRLTGALSGIGNTPGHTTQGSAILLSDTVGYSVRNVHVDAADDAGIRVEGYNSTTVFPIVDNDPDTNAGFGHSYDGVIDGNTIRYGYLGIELEGGASAQITNNTVHATTFHGIRLPHARDCIVANNIVTEVLGNAVYADYCNRVVIRSNDLEADPTKHDIALGHLKACIVAANICASLGISDYVFIVDTATVGTGVVIADNYIPTGTILINYNARASIKNNTLITGTAQIQGYGTGMVEGNYQHATVVRRSVEWSQSGNAQAGRPIFTLTVPNDHICLVVEVVGMLSRAPAPASGAGRFAKKTFTVSRVTGSNVVVAALVGAGECDLATASAGGANNVAALNLGISRVGAEPATDPQVVQLTADFTAAFSNYGAGYATLIGEGIDDINVFVS